MAQPPTLSAADRQAALAKAAEVRLQRAEIRTQLKSGEITIGDLLERLDDDVVGKMKALTVIESVPGIGKVKARRLMQEVRIAESRRLRGLGNKQVQNLLARLTARGD